MPDEAKCSRCGAAGPHDLLPDGLCLGCLLALGLKRAGTAELSASESHAPGTDSGVLPDERFDNFRLIEKIGEGGCGIVYRAEQFEPVRRDVALKVIKLGMDTRNVIARFEAERQALAMMDHPGIAKVFDAGATSTGRPYFVMELVRGERITDYCARCSLPLDQRLHLFAEVCRAIQHAHQKGIIHRDIKPSNILVTESDGLPHPRVIDFGVAKAIARQRLGEETLYTVFDQFVGTPAYMSPEQTGLGGDDVDTRSDIYSLGVLLYEMLAGCPPFDLERLRLANFRETCRIIAEEEPLKPSARLARNVAAAALDCVNDDDHGERARARDFAAKLEGDLDCVVLKAMEKDRERRYESASALALDVERFLKSEPVSALPPSASYRLRKFLRRHRPAALAIALVTIAMVAGTIVSTAMAVRAHRAEREQSRLREEAQREAAAGQRVMALLDDSYNRWRPVAGRRRHTLAWTTLVESLRERAGQSLKRQQPLTGRLIFLLIQADHFSWSGDLSDAEILLREGLKLSAQLPTGNEDIRAGVKECLALVLRRAHRSAEADQLFHEALDLRQEYQKADPEAIYSSYAYAAACDRAREQGNLAEAETMGRLHMEALKQKFGATNLATAGALLNLGKILAAEKKMPEAGDAYREGLETMRATPVSADDPELDEIHGDFVRALDEAAAHFLNENRLH
ncbi:MAG TPA: serine/threonine-protein kinase, partial [Verrucomicrobiae bacterium]|nr:serine/threonine-protein kinase [Verrucomicrobiae bacterium]